MKILFSVVLLTMVVLTGCATNATQSEIELLQDAYVSEGAGAEPTVKRKGQNVAVKENPIIIEAPGFVSTVLLPGAEHPGKYKIALRPIEQWGGEQLEKKQSVMLNGLVASMNEVQMLLGSNRAGEALSKLEEILRAHPRVTYLNFLKASCLVMLGDQSQAKAVLEATLVEFPDNKLGQMLYHQIVGGGLRKRPLEDQPGQQQGGVQ